MSDFSPSSHLAFPDIIPSFVPPSSLRTPKGGSWIGEVRVARVNSFLQLNSSSYYGIDFYWKKPSSSSYCFIYICQGASLPIPETSMRDV